MQWLLMLIVLLAIAALIWWWWRSRSAASTASSGGAAAVAPAPMPLPSAATVDADPAAVNVDLADPWKTDVVGGDDLADDASVDVGGGDGTDESSWAEEPASDDGPVFHADAVVDTVDTVEGADVVNTDESVAPAPRGLTAVGAVADGTFGPGSADPADDGSGPDGYDIKANADSMLFHTTDSPYYGRTTAEVWFDSESSAEAAGFTRWDDRGQNAGGSSEDGDTVADDSPTAPQGIVSVARVPDGAFGPGSADPAEDGSGPDGYDIKGNADSMLYHTVESRYYGVTKADVWFETEEAARNAGFRNVDD